jgi:hypothetical protein
MKDKGTDEEVTDEESQMKTGPLITSPSQITVFTLYISHALSTGTYNYMFYAYYWSLYKIQVLS